MPEPCRRFLGLASLVLLPALVPVAAPAAEAGTAPPPAELYARLPEIGDLAVSPNGKRLALLVNLPDRSNGLAVMDLDPPGKPRVIVKEAGWKIQYVRWVNDQRLVYDAAGDDGPVVREGMYGTYAADHDGANVRQLINAVRLADSTKSSIVSRVLPHRWAVAATLADGSDDVLVYHASFDARGEPEGYAPARLNTRTGQLTYLSWGMPPHVTGWWLNADREPALLMTAQQDRSKLFWRARRDDAWQEVADFDRNAWDFTPQFVDTDGRIIVRAQRGGVGQLFVFDPVRRQLDKEPLLGIKGFDLRVQPLVDRHSQRLLGVRFSAGSTMDYWFDDEMARIQRSLDAALPKDRSNLLYCGNCSGAPTVVVDSRSDRQPGELFLYDRAKRSLARIGSVVSWVDEARQGRRTLHRVAMRDGLQIPVYVTHPAGSAPDAPLPTVVLVHGGPWERGATQAWSSEPQFLASRGYRVLEPEFRGSTGYGATLWKAGWKQWGRAMQDDLADTLAWAAAQKLSDPGRACVMGASYGGYAALMAPITHPGTWRCAISFAGVTDIDLMYDIAWSDLSDEYKRYGMPVLIGDQKADAAMLAAASPIRRAAEIKVPVLLAHGGLDRRVPIEHAKRFVSAAEDAGVSIERRYYGDEGHGWYYPANQADFLRRVEAFLAKHTAARP